MKKGLSLTLGLALTVMSHTLRAQTTLRTDTIPEVVVTGTGTQHLLKNAPVQTEVITQKMLAQYGGRSLEDILAGLTASFAFNEDDMGSQMQMNGLGNSYILILIDGKRIHGDNGGQNDLGLIDPSRIERIEIVKGAASALYGSDAIAGVINIITRKYPKGWAVENESRGGSYADLRQHNTVGLTLGKVQSLTNFHYRHTNGWQNTGEEDPTQIGGRVITDSQNKTVNKNSLYQLSERLAWQPMKGMDIYADGMWYHKRIYRPNGKYAMADVHGYDLSYDDAAASAGWSWLTKKDYRLTADLMWNRHGYYYDYTSEKGWLVESDDPALPYIYYDGDRALQADQRRTMLQLKCVFPLAEQHRLSVGYDFRHDWLRAPLRIDSDRARDWTQAIYAQEEWNPLKVLNMTAGLRLDHNGQFGLHLTPKLSAMLSLGDFRIRASWAQGFKSPTPKEQHYRYVRDMGGVRLFLGNTDLKPQTSNYLSLNAEYRIAKVNISATGYYNKVDNMINLVTIPTNEAPGDLILQYDPAFVRQYKNLEDAYTTGVDVNVRWNAGKGVTVGGGYSYLKARGSVYDEKTEQLHRLTIDGTAHHKGNLFATWSYLLKGEKREERGNRIGLGLYGRASSTRYYENYGNGKAYHLWRLTGSYDFSIQKAKAKSTTSFRVEAGIDNIFNYVDRTPHGRHLGTTTPGTTVYAALIIRFHQGTKVKQQSNYSTLKQSKDETD